MGNGNICQLENTHSFLWNNIPEFSQKDILISLRLLPKGLIQPIMIPGIKWERFLNLRLAISVRESPLFSKGTNCAKKGSVQKGLSFGKFTAHQIEMEGLFYSWIISIISLK